MCRTVGGLLVLGLGLSAPAAEHPAREGPGTPAEQYKALLKAQELASSPGRVLTDEERMVFIGETYKRWNEIASRFVELAERYPKDPVAVDALIRAVWYVNSTPWPVELVGEDDARARAFALLLRDHIRSDQFGPLCERVSGGFCKEYETFLRGPGTEPLPGSPAQACLALAHYLANRSQRLELIRDQPELAREFGDLFGREYLAGLLRQDRDQASVEAETLFEQAARDFGDVKPPGGGSTIGERAEAGLFEIRHLVVGKMAPRIEGEDQDGRRFQLSDYRGKVVLIDFWSEY